MKKEKVIERLEQILEDGPWRSKTEFCEAVGITPQILSNLFNSDMNREIPKSIVYGLARLNYNITWFLYGHGPMKNQTVDAEVLTMRHKLDTLEKMKSLIQEEEKAIEKRSIQSEGGARSASIV
jgi:hypothetical protein